MWDCIWLLMSESLCCRRKIGSFPLLDLTHFCFKVIFLLKINISTLVLMQFHLCNSWCLCLSHSHFFLWTQIQSALHPSATIMIMRPYSPHLPQTPRACTWKQNSFPLMDEPLPDYERYFSLYIFICLFCECCKILFSSFLKKPQRGLNR